MELSAVWVLAKLTLKESNIRKKMRVVVFLFLMNEASTFLG